MKVFAVVPANADEEAEARPRIRTSEAAVVRGE